jgi:hypothetical protein
MYIDLILALAVLAFLVCALIGLIAAIAAVTPLGVPLIRSRTGR